MFIGRNGCIHKTTKSTSSSPCIWLRCLSNILYAPCSEMFKDKWHSATLFVNYCLHHRPIFGSFAKMHNSFTTILYIWHWDYEVYMPRVLYKLALLICLECSLFDRRQDTGHGQKIKNVIQKHTHTE